jgi:hypothetical protein
MRLPYRSAESRMLIKKMQPSLRAKRTDA